MDMTIFDEFDRIFNRMAGYHRPAWYGITMGRDGCSAVDRLGNAQSGIRPIQVDVIPDEKNNEVKLVAEIPGVEKKDIQITMDDDRVSIRVVRNGTTYEAGVPVDGGADRKSVRASYRNGILEIVFGLADKPKGTVVRVE